MIKKEIIVFMLENSKVQTKLYLQKRENERKNYTLSLSRCSSETKGVKETISIKLKSFSHKLHFIFNLYATYVVLLVSSLV